MRAYLFPLETALIMFPLLSALLVVPYMLFTYHRYGRISPLRTLILFSFFFYLLCAYFLVILPLPDPDSVKNNTGPFMQLQPFYFVRYFIERTPLRLDDPHTYLAALKHTTFFQPVLNFLLTVPFGMYMAYYFRLKFRHTLVLSFLLSLFFEITQLSGLYGIYSKPYRLFDVDDLMLNTLGGAFGYLLGSKLLKFLPTRGEIDASSIRQSVHVSYTRRLCALVLDIVLLNVITIPISFLLSFRGLHLAVYFAYFVVLQRVLGSTPGKMVVRIRIAPEGSGIPLSLRLAIRYACLYLYPFLFEGSAGRYPILGSYSALIFMAAFGVFCLISLVDLFASRRHEKRLWYERISHTRTVSVISLKQKDCPG